MARLQRELKMVNDEEIAPEDTKRNEEAFHVTYSNKENKKVKTGRSMAKKRNT